MLEHVSVPVSDFKKSKKLYDAMLKPLGYKVKYQFSGACGYMEGGHTSLWIGEKGKKVMPIHVAFLAKSKSAVQKFYEAARKAGARDNGGPGFRTDYGDDYYAAFVYDFDGNNIEACYFGEKAPKK
ncbi:MAG: VOC family protein [Minisyncoccia bacterium]